MSKTTGRNKRKKGLRILITFYLSFSIAFILDRITKIIIVSKIPENVSVEIFPFLYLRNIKNTGICFGFFDAPVYMPLLIVASIVVLILIFLFVHRRRKLLSAFSYFCLGLVSGGILGNLFDRVGYKGVIDFIDFRVWPVFNLADTFIVCGIGGLIIFYSRRKDASRVF